MLPILLAMLVSCKTDDAPNHPLSAPRLVESVTIIGDVDGDGFDDAAGSALALGREWGFVYPQDVAPTYFRSAYGSGDFDGDGQADLLISNPQVVFLNADLTVRADVFLRTTPTGLQPNNASNLGDIDEDGKDDLIAPLPRYRPSGTNQDRGAFAIWFGDAWTDDPMADQIIVGSESQRGLASTLKLADINADGKTDVVVTHDLGVAVYLASATGFNATADWLYATQTEPDAFVGDVDGDGYRDITIRQDTTLHVVRGGPDFSETTGSTWELPVANDDSYRLGWSLPAPPYHQLFRSEEYFDEAIPPYTQRLTVVDDQLTSKKFALVGGLGVAPSIGDVNGDGFSDAIDGGRLAIGTADGLSMPEFVDRPAHLIGVDILAAHDFDTDGTTDLIRRSSTADELVYSDGSIVRLHAPYLGISGDRDANGDLDILMRAAGGQCSVAEASAAAASPQSTWDCGDTVVGDLNDDGVADTYGHSDGSSRLYLSSQGGPSLPVTLPTGRPALNVGDIDGDGVDDLVLQRGSRDDVVEGWFGSSEWPTLGPRDFTIPAQDAAAFAAGDMNGDGFADLWLSSGPDIMALHLGDANGLSPAPSDIFYPGEARVSDRVRTLTLPGESSAITVLGDSRFSGITILRATTDGTLRVALTFPGHNGTLFPFTPIIGIPLDESGVLTLTSFQDRLTLLIDEDGDGIYRGTDCDDADASVQPILQFGDFDNDGYGGFTTLLCAPPTYTFATREDCSDNNALVSPGVQEQCNDQADYDCDGLYGAMDPDVDAPTYYWDGDGDGFNGMDEERRWCDPPRRWTTTPPTDCDDNNADAFPGATEVCDGRDTDCNGTIDDVSTSDAVAYVDEDGDGWGTTQTEVCPSEEGFAPEGGDCEPQNPEIHPGAEEVWYDGIDQDCDGNDDDQDFDGFSVDEDCNDTNVGVNPGADERWYDGVDQNCDGNDDDQDGDGTPVASDCDDQAPDITDNCDRGCSTVGTPSGFAGLALFALALVLRTRPKKHGITN